MLSCPIDFIFKVSLTIIIFVSLLYMGITIYFNRKKYFKLSYKKYEALLNCYDNPIVVLDKSFRYAAANQYYINKVNEYTGEKYTIDSILGLKITEVSNCSSRADEFKDSIEVCKYVMDAKKPMDTTLCCKNSKGDSFWYELVVNPYGEEILVVIRDVTEKMINQNIIAENEIKYRNLVEQSLDGIVLVDKEGYIIEFNREMERISGIKKENAINMHVVDIQNEMSNGKAYEGKDIDDIKKNFEGKHIDGKSLGKSEIYFAKINNRSGENIDVEEFYYPIITENAKMVCFIFRDITEIKRLEKIKEKAEENERLAKEAIELDRLRTEFFANLSHEFRTPLNIILNANRMIQTLMDNSHEASQVSMEHDKVKKYLMSSKQNCYRLLRLINNIIDITKMDSGFYHSNFQCWNIVSVVEEITQSIAEYAKNKGIHIVFDTDIEEKNTLCDADAIERIILNLLSNSIKFTDMGGNIKVTLKDMDNNIEITVEDSGIGIPKDQLPLIFNRFKQVDKSLARRQEGSGIGLSLVKSLVEMHEGTIEAFSKIGKGTKFIIMLPVKDSYCTDEIAACKELYDSKVEKVNIEFSDIYF